MESVYSAVVGLLAGLMSGFFGVGGGSITVPALAVVGFSIKNAIGISVVQMFFGSIFGSFVNYRDGVLDIKRYAPLLYGGIVGGLVGAYFANIASDSFLYIFFLAILAFAIIKSFFSPAESNAPQKGSFVLFSTIGFVIGMISGMLGVGGAIILTPILVGFLNFSIKTAINVSLFFVVASSLSAMVGLAYFGHIDFVHGLAGALFSLIGVWFGIHLARKVDSKRLKALLIMLYILTFGILLNKAIVA